MVRPDNSYPYGWKSGRMFRLCNINRKRLGKDHATTIVLTRLIKSTHISEPMSDIAWDISSDGQFILAVAFARKIGIYGEKRAESVNDDFGTWVSYVTFDVDT